MQTMRDDLAELRERESRCLLPMAYVQGIRLTRIQQMRLASQAATLKSTPSEVVRLLLEKGAEHYGLEINSVL